MKKFDFFDIASAAYSICKNGAVDKIRYRRIYQAVSEYISANHSGAVYTKLAKTHSGWSCIVRNGRVNTVIYITEKDNGEIHFWENKI